MKTPIAANSEVTMMRCCRILALSTITALLADLAIAYWWLSFGPIPESAWPS